MTGIKKIYNCLFCYWMKFPQKIRFLLVGGWNFVVAYALFTLLLWSLGAKNEQCALLLSFLLSSVQSYWTQKLFVFLTQGRFFSEYFKCLLTWSVGYFINAILLYIGVKLLQVNTYLCQFVVQALIAVMNYIVLKYFAFHVKTQTS